jgi:hypothetical protein
VDGIAFGTRTRRVGVRQEPLCCGFATAGAEIGSSNLFCLAIETGGTMC